MGYSVYASVRFGIELTDWISDGEIFSIDDVYGEIPTEITDVLNKNSVSIEYVSAEYLDTRVYLEASGWGAYTEDINARDFGQSLGTCAPPSADTVKEMETALLVAVKTIAAHYQIDAPDLEPEIIVKASFG